MKKSVPTPTETQVESKKIDNKVAQTIIETINNSRSLTKVTLTNCTFDRRGAITIREFLKVSPTITEIDLAGTTFDNDIEDQAKIKFFTSIIANPDILRINLSNCGLVDRINGAVFTSLISNKSYEYVNLSSNDIGDAGAVQLDYLITFSGKIKHLVLSNNSSISDDSTQRIIKAVNANNHITRCDINGVVISKIPSKRNQKRNQRLQRKLNKSNTNGLLPHSQTHSLPDVSTLSDDKPSNLLAHSKEESPKNSNLQNHRTTSEQSHKPIPLKEIIVSLRKQNKFLKTAHMQHTIQIQALESTVDELKKTVEILSTNYSTLLKGQEKIKMQLLESSKAEERVSPLSPPTTPNIPSKPKLLVPKPMSSYPSHVANGKLSPNSPYSPTTSHSASSQETPANSSVNIQVNMSSNGSNVNPFLSKEPFQDTLHSPKKPITPAKNQNLAKNPPAQITKNPFDGADNELAAKLKRRNSSIGSSCPGP
ncbi:MAG: hypothetical protein IPP74_02990 [Alphaproteobacteria bacterium]|nr:hypothetical protein [Alphaproteobacteria bacterium]